MRGGSGLIIDAAGASRSHGFRGRLFEKRLCLFLLYNQKRFRSRGVWMWKGRKSSELVSYSLAFLGEVRGDSQRRG